MVKVFVCFLIFEHQLRMHNNVEVRMLSSHSEGTPVSKNVQISKNVLHLSNGCFKLPPRYEVSVWPCDGLANHPVSTPSLPNSSLDRLPATSWPWKGLSGFRKWMERTSVGHLMGSWKHYMVLWYGRKFLKVSV